MTFAIFHFQKENRMKLTFTPGMMSFILSDVNLLLYFPFYIIYILESYMKKKIEKGKYWRVRKKWKQKVSEVLFFAPTLSWTRWEKYMGFSLFFLICLVGSFPRLSLCSFCFVIPLFTLSKHPKQMTAEHNKNYKPQHSYNSTFFWPLYPYS